MANQSSHSPLIKIISNKTFYGKLIRNIFKLRSGYSGPESHDPLVWPSDDLNLKFSKVYADRKCISKDRSWKSIGSEFGKWMLVFNFSFNKFYKKIFQIYTCDILFQQKSRKDVSEKLNSMIYHWAINRKLNCHVGSGNGSRFSNQIIWSKWILTFLFKWKIYFNCP